MSPSSLLAVWLLVLGAVCAPAALARGIRADAADSLIDRVNQEVADFRALIATGDAAHGITTLDPLNIKQVPVNVKSSALTASGQLNDVKATGASALAVSKLEQTSGNGKSGRVSVSFNIPSIVVTTEYDLKGKLKVSFITVKISGKSPVTATVSGINVGADADVTINSDDSITVNELSNVSLNIDKVKVKVNSFSGIVNNLLNKLIPNIIKSNRAKAVQLIQTKGKDALNKYFDLKAGKTSAASVLTKPLAKPFVHDILLSPLAEHIIEKIARELKVVA